MGVATFTHTVNKTVIIKRAWSLVPDRPRFKNPGSAVPNTALMLFHFACLGFLVCNGIDSGLSVFGIRIK